MLRYDSRVLGQLITDNGIAADEAAVLASNVTAQALEDASGDVVSFAVKGGRYSETDLAALTGNGKAYLERLVCNLALYYLVLRRGLPVDKYPQVLDALDALEKLSQGHLVFPVLANIEAGVAQSPPITIETIVDNNYPINQVRYFPTPPYTLQQGG